MRRNLQLFGSVATTRTGPQESDIQFYSCEDAWIAILYLLGIIVAQYHRLSVEGRANAPDSEEMLYIRSLRDATSPASCVPFFLYISESLGVMIERELSGGTGGTTDPPLQPGQTTVHPRLASEAADKAREILDRMLRTFDSGPLD